MWVDFPYGVEKAVGLAVCVDMAVGDGAVVGVFGTEVALGMMVAVKGSAVSVNGSVGLIMTVLPGRGVGIGVRVATFGTHSVSPG